SARPAFGEDHPEMLAAAHMLAQLHREADDPMAARRTLEQAIAAGERRWGFSDPLMLALCYELGSVAEELGNRHEARKNFNRVATSGPAVLGEDHWQVRAAREYLGEARGTPPPPTESTPATSAPSVVTPPVTPPPVTPPPSSTTSALDEPTTVLPITSAAAATPADDAPATEPTP